MLNLYIIPIEHLSGAEGLHDVPMYLPSRWKTEPPTAGLEGVAWMWTTYLLGDIGIIVCDVNTTQNSILSGLPHVFPIPNFDAVVPNANIQNTIRTELETAFVPGLWVNTGMTYRLILRRVGGEFTYHGRIVGILGRKLFDETKTLDTTIAECTQAEQAAFIKAAGDLGFTYSATGATTLRELIQSMGEQRAGVEFIISGNIGSLVV